MIITFKTSAMTKPGSLIRQQKIQNDQAPYAMCYLYRSALETNYPNRDTSPANDGKGKMDIFFQRVKTIAIFK